MFSKIFDYWMLLSIFDVDHHSQRKSNTYFEWTVVLWQVYINLIFFLLYLLWIWICRWSNVLKAINCCWARLISLKLLENFARQKLWTHSWLNSSFNFFAKTLNTFSFFCLESYSTCMFYVFVWRHLKFKLIFLTLKFYYMCLNLKNRWHFKIFFKYQTIAIKCIVLLWTISTGYSM